MVRPILAVCAFLAAAHAAVAQTAWKLVWSDEFNGAAKSLPDQTKWTYDLGASGWGNNELENYTSTLANAQLDGNGNLVISALHTASGYTSARLKTQGKFTTTYGKIEARMKIPYGQGIWPAFWMLGSDIDTAGWPACGEIDIMENIGREPSIVHGSMHGPGYSGGSALTAAYTLPNGQKFSGDFHIFSVVWSPQSVEFFVDGNSYEKVAATSIPAGTQWVFNKPFFLLLNVAVGGSWPGYPDSSSQFPQTMTVDYVRVYQAAAAPAISSGGVVDAASFASAMAPGSLASIFGTGLADLTDSDLFDPSAGAFRKSAGTTSVSVNGVLCPLTYASPGQINFQIPWEIPVGTPATVQVTRDGIPSNSEPITLTATAPSAFGVNGVAILGCVGASPKVCTLWGNGFGPKKLAQHDGAPSSLASLAWTANPCKLAIGAVDANITFCGAAPGLIIDQLNFDYPAGVSSTGSTIAATLTVGSASSNVLLPGPR